MATISTTHLPELTAERAQEACADYFQGKYEVYPTKIRNRDFIVKKSDWAGVGVRVKQETGKTTFVFSALMPNMILQALFGGLAAYLFLRSSWKQLESEVAAFITTCPDFQPAQAPAPEPTRISPPDGPSGGPEAEPSEQPAAQQPKTKAKAKPKTKRTRKRKAA